MVDITYLFACVAVERFELSRFANTNVQPYTKQQKKNQSHLSQTNTREKKIFQTISNQIVDNSFF